MRLSSVLWKQHLGWMFKQKWKLKSKIKITDYGVPEDLKALNVKIYDVLEVARPKKKEIPKIEPPDPYKLNPYLIKGPGNPNWHDQYVFWFDRNSILIEGDKQGKVLTKTIGYEGFPSSLKNNVDDLSDLEIEDIVRHCVLESTLWDGVQEKLPKRVDPERPTWNFRREFGISHNRKILNLLTRLLHLCERISVRKNNNIFRMQIIDPKVKLRLNIYDDPVIFEAVNNPLESPDILLCSDKPLPLLFNKEEVQMTINEEFPDLYPLKPVISLEKVNIFTDENIYPLDKDQHPHTLFITHDSLEEWSTSQKFARALGLTFAYAASHAQLLYGENVKELPTPIVIQSVWVDNGCLGFLSFQLNTLDLNSKDGIKNQLYQAGPFNLYDESNLKNGLSGFNSEAFVKMLAMYMNGM
ncbi:39S ribosomal protein L37, mitochondrial-like [Centruroides sculpturatus]|uniref:39S ribosomal protein L37, mitochondrial-like n=1 Tax=Centruroides sculpturatus TaxID=218467 RepID=UPI000C6CFB64|nr:39S ribosomal protein L37, mitochondrial-like [Centruroides sculpturatus]